MAIDAVAGENGQEAVEAPPRQTRSSAGTVRGFAPLEPPPCTRSCGITWPPISMYIMKIPAPWIRNLRWYSLIATTFALAGSGSIDRVLHSLRVAVLLQFIAIILDRP